eukprot:535792-Pelagomonas_calceolata.AAC.3
MRKLQRSSLVTLTGLQGGDTITHALHDAGSLMADHTSAHTKSVTQLAEEICIERGGGFVAGCQPRLHTSN